MFSSKTSDVVSFNSELCATKSETSANVQTKEIVYTADDTQTAETRSVGIQTVDEQKANTEVNHDKLAQFLRKVTPAVLEALDEAYGTNAFDGYDPNVAEPSCANIKLLKEIRVSKKSDTQVKISDLSWSIVGGTLAVGLSHTYHEAWCDHLSTIQLYNFITTEDNFIDTPVKTLETSGCVTTLCYHPTEPSIIAAGLSNWDVFVWNCRDDDFITSTHVCVHNDCISQIYWWRSRSVNDVTLLLSSSKDGFILSHKMTANFTTVSLHKRFKIVKERNPVENARPRSAGGVRERAAEAGLCITSLDFSPKYPSIFIVGTLCGGIYKCSLDSVTSIEGDTTVIDPVIDEYERHGSSITCIRCSPLSDLFISSATDKEIRIYNLDEHTSLQSFSVDNTVVGLTWMMGNLNVFATYGAGASVKFYNVMDGKPVTCIKLQATSGESISSLCVNFKRDLLAVGDIHANIEIWKFPRQNLDITTSKR